jgi:nitrogenase iron protein NifH
MRKIAIYGKGGIGKSTTTANVAAAMADAGKTVLQIGCDPKHDSTRTLVGRLIPTVLDVWREKKGDLTVISREMVLFRGYGGVLCTEAGGPEPGVGCAGRGVIRTMDALTDLGVFDEEYDYTFFDVLGDVVCGGFAKPIQKGYAKDIYIVTSGEFMSLYAANNIAQAIKNIAETSPGDCSAQLAGIIGNLRGLEREKETLEVFAARLHTRLIHCIPRDPVIQTCERNAMTVLQGKPDAAVSAEYRALAAKIDQSYEAAVPATLTFDELAELCRREEAAA